MSTISIVSIVNVVDALASDKINEHFFLMDDNPGSLNKGKANLRTKVKQGDKLIWRAQSLESEAFISIDKIVIDPKICKPFKLFFEGTAISYWIATVLKDVEYTPYSFNFKVGLKTATMNSSSGCCLIGANE